ncbi:hypothetical protein TWF594_011446 [Orbilia oligospora]|nr:hypothetical protein TWF594_011446 [Orbilia oligospora]
MSTVGSKIRSTLRNFIFFDFHLRQLAKKLVPDGGFCSKFEYISTELVRSIETVPNKHICTYVHYARRAQIPKLRFVILKWVAEFGTHPLIISWQAQVA